MIWNKVTIIYASLLALFLGYYTYCSAFGKSIYGLGDRTTYGTTGYTQNGHTTYVRGFNHK